MTLEIAESNLQAIQQRNSSTAVGYSVASELNVRTQEGDLVSLSFSSEQSLSESRTQAQSEEFGSFQEISTVAKAASNYSISVQGDLNEEELAAINKLAAEISPIASEFFSSGEFDFDESGDVLAANPPSRFLLVHCTSVRLYLSLTLDRTMLSSARSECVPC